MFGRLVAPRLRARRMAVLMAVDALAVVVGYAVNAWLRYPAPQLPEVTRHVAIVAVVTVLLHWALGFVVMVYRGRVAVASSEETVSLGLVAATAGAVVGLGNMLSDPPYAARSLPFTAAFSALVLMLLGRAAWRLVSDRAGGGNHAAEPALIVGAGWTGRKLVQSMLESPHSPLRPVGILDDDPWKRRRRHHGVPVVGTVDDLPSAVRRSGATAVVIAIPTATTDLKRRIAELGTDLGIDVKVVPTLFEAVAGAPAAGGRGAVGSVDIRDVRDIDLHDVLGRSAVETDVESIAHYLTGKRVLVTGAGGSIGSELCRQIDRWGPAELIMLDRDESALHSLQLALRGRALLDSAEVVLADIRDEVSVRRVFQERRPHVVFHAAALKHLPMLEQYPDEALKTNVHGTAHVLAAAAAVGVEHMVNISTDKAADPTSVLGTSKRIAEMLTAGVAGGASGAWCSVRFGNVLGSRGSVLTAFAAQIAAGGPVTVTHPEVTRYFMTVEEAVQLVIQAGALGADGDTMVLDMGQPVRIEEIARRLISQSGKRIEVVYTGLREGEKMHEHLFGAAESHETCSHPLISHVAVPPLGLDVVHAVPPGLDDAAIRGVLQRWVEEGASMGAADAMGQPATGAG